MTIIMIIYYLISLFMITILVWNFLSEKKDINNMILYLIVLIPFLLRIFRLK